MAVATFEEMIKGLHTFSYDMDAYIELMKSKEEPFSKSLDFKEENRRVATPEEVLRSIHDR